MPDVRTVIHETLQATTQAMDADPGSLLVGWTVIAEWVDPEGNRHLSNISSENMVEWQRRGYLHDRLYSPTWDDHHADDS